MKTQPNEISQEAKECADKILRHCVFRDSIAEEVQKFGDKAKAPLVAQLKHLEIDESKVGERFREMFKRAKQSPHYWMEALELVEEENTRLKESLAKYENSKRIVN